MRRLKGVPSLILKGNFNAYNYSAEVLYSKYYDESDGDGFRIMLPDNAEFVMKVYHDQENQCAEIYFDTIGLKSFIDNLDKDQQGLDSIKIQNFVFIENFDFIGTVYYSAIDNITSIYFDDATEANYLVLIYKL